MVVNLNWVKDVSGLRAQKGGWCTGAYWSLTFKKLKQTFVEQSVAWLSQ